MHKLTMEFIGTFFLVLTIGLTGDALAIGLVLAGLIYMGAHISGAHYNPAVSLGFFIASKLSLNDFLRYFLAQILGAFTASAVIYFIVEFAYYIEPSNLAQLYKQATIEVLLTFVFVIVFLTVSLAKQYKRSNVNGLVIGLTLAGVIMVGSPLSGAILNPAQMLGSSLFDLITGGASYRFIPLYTLAPFAGGGLAGMAYLFFNRDKN